MNKPTPNVDQYFSQAHRSRKRRRAGIMACIVLVALYIVFLGSALVVFRTPLFRIQKVEISGNESISDAQIKDVFTAVAMHTSRIAPLLGVSNILAWPSELSATDLKYLPSIETISIHKNYLDRTVSIKITERHPFGVWCVAAGQVAAAAAPPVQAPPLPLDIPSSTANTSSSTPAPTPPLAATPGISSCWWFNQDGYLFRKSYIVEGSLIHVVHDYSQTAIGLNSKILPDQFIAPLFSILKVLSAAGLGIKEVRLNDLNLQEIEVTTYEGPRLYFSLRFSADDNLSVIKLLQSKGGFANLQYLDFRVQNRAYYK